MSVGDIGVMRTFVRDLLVDPAGEVVDSTTLERDINDAYVALKGLTDDRPRYLSATATGLTFAAGDRSKVTSLVTIREVLRVFPAASAGVTVASGRDLEWYEPWELRARQAEDATQGTPAAFSWVRQGTATVADIGKQEFMLWRIPAATTYVVLLAHVEPAALTSSDTPDLSDVEWYAMAYAVAVRRSLMMGRDDGFIAGLEAHVPERLRAAFGIAERARGPRPRPGEAPA